MPEYPFISSNEKPEVKPYPTTPRADQYTSGPAYIGIDLDLKPNYVCRDLNPCPPGCAIGDI